MMSNHQSWSRDSSFQISLSLSVDCLTVLILAEKNIVGIPLYVKDMESKCTFSSQVRSETANRPITGTIFDVCRGIDVPCYFKFLWVPLNFRYTSR